MSVAAEPLAPPVARASLQVRLRSMMYLLGPHRGLIAAAIVTGAGHQLLLAASAGTGAWLVAQAATGASASDLTTGLIVLAALIVPLALMNLADTYFAHTLSPLAVAATVPLATVIALITFHWALALAFVPALILLATVPSWLRRRAEAQGRDLREALGNMSAEVVDTFQGLRELVSFGGEPAGWRCCAPAARHCAPAGSRTVAGPGWNSRRPTRSPSRGCSPCSSPVPHWSTTDPWTGRGFPLRSFSPPSLLPVIKVTDVARDLSLVAAAADRITTILRAPAPVTDLVDVAPSGPIEPRIRFEAVSFRYGPALRAAVDEVSFEVAAGETVALVGHSGPASRPAPICYCVSGTSKRVRSRSAATTCVSSPGGAAPATDPRSSGRLSV